MFGFSASRDWAIHFDEICEMITVAGLFTQDTRFIDKLTKMFQRNVITETAVTAAAVFHPFTQNVRAAGISVDEVEHVLGVDDEKGINVPFFHTSQFRCFTRIVGDVFSVERRVVDFKDAAEEGRVGGFMKDVGDREIFRFGP